MPAYKAPLREMRFLLEELLDVGQLSRLPGHEEATPDTIAAILAAGAELCEEELAPLNRPGDEEGCHFENGVVRTPAAPGEDGSWKITGNKIFISAGEHDLTENIVHLVLARLPDAPAGTRGISLFVVPKFLPNADGTLGPRNGVGCSRLEHKM